MRTLVNLRIRTKLLFSCTALAALVVIVGYFGLSTVADINGQLKLYEKHAQGINNLQEANGELLRIARELRNAIIDHSPEAVEKRVQSIRKYDASFRERYANYSESIVLDATKKLASEALQRFDQLRSKQDSLVELARQGKGEEAAAGLKEVRSIADELDVNFDELIATKLKLMEESQVKAKQRGETAQKWILAAGAMATCLAIALGLLLTRIIVKPLSETITIFEAITKRDFSKKHSYVSKDELGEIASALNVTVDKLGQQEELNADYSGQIAAIGKALVVSEFKMDGTVISANENFFTTLGYSLDEIKGGHHSRFVSETEKQSSGYREFWAKLNRGEFVAGEFNWFGKGGKDIWMQASYNPITDSNGKLFKVVKYATDITAEKVRNADFTGQIAAISKVQAVTELNLNGTVITANDNFLKTFGFTLDEIKGGHHHRFVDDAEKNSSSYQEFWTKLGHGESVSGEFKRLGKGGKEIWIQASYNPIIDCNGKPYKVVEYATDVTSLVAGRHRLQQMLQQLNDSATTLGASAEELTANSMQMASNAEETSAQANVVSALRSRSAKMCRSFLLASRR